MAITRHFLGWDGPILGKAVARLLAARHERVLDLEDQVLVVPTQQAGRRLREALAAAAAEFDGVVAPGRVITPEQLVRPELPEVPVATPLEALAVWAHCLVAADLQTFPALFPRPPEPQGWSWALRTAEQLNRLRHELGERGLAIGDVPATLGDDVPEPERWDDLGRLETLYLDRMATLGLQDPEQARVATARQPETGPEVRRVVMIGVSAPLALSLTALGTLAERLPVEVWIAAPPEAEARFDEWGRPLQASWLRSVLPIAEPARDIVLCADPADQARQTVLALQALAAGSGVGISDMAVGVPDAEVATTLTDALAAHEIQVHNPAGKPLRDHAVLQLLAAWHDVLHLKSFAAVARLLRHPDVLEYLEPLKRSAGRNTPEPDAASADAPGGNAATFAGDLFDFAASQAPAAAGAGAGAHRHVMAAMRASERPSGLAPRGDELLRDLDVLQNRHLPETLNDLRRVAHDRPRVRRALDWIDACRTTVARQPCVVAIRAFLAELYRWRVLRIEDESDRVFEHVAEAVDEVLQELESPILGDLALTSDRMLELLLHRLRRQSYFTEPEPGALELEGWLELPWNDARVLVLTGMNDGFAPETIVADLFLPDSLRRRLGLPCNDSRFARDTYLLHAMLCSRRPGEVRLLCGKTSSQKDPLRPSRLLFQCTDDELPERVRRLFGDLAHYRDEVPRSISWRLQPPEPARRPPAHMRVTEFRSYLACPFRYYLGNVLRMEPMDDRKQEMNALDYGSLCHDALDRLGKDPAVRDSTNVAQLIEFLRDAAAQWVTARYGPKPPLPVTIQLDTAQQRLAAAARVQVRLRESGWRILHTEHSIGGEHGVPFHGLLLRGKIDRIDIHDDTGRYRIIDYKTSDRASHPVDTHLRSGRNVGEQPEWQQVTVGGKTHVWMDLQIPLYHLLLRQEFGNAPGCGYFNLPKAVTDTNIAIWEDFDDALATSARACAEGVIDAIAAGVFWPPAKATIFDPFAEMLFGDAESHVDGTALVGSTTDDDDGKASTP